MERRDARLRIKELETQLRDSEAKRHEAEAVAARSRKNFAQLFQETRTTEEAPKVAARTDEAVKSLHTTKQELAILRDFVKEVSNGRGKSAKQARAVLDRLGG